jgi:two-component system, cell cycle sensor histidine kinase and response regulator CckA
MQPTPLPQHPARAEMLFERDAPAGVESEAMILLAEDDPAVRSLLARVLRSRGYTVVEAANGAEAILAAEANPLPFQLLLTDVVMPKVNGPELATRLLRDGYARRVIFMTGYADVLLDAQQAVTVLRKPFTPAVLTEAVRAALGQ